MTGAWITVRKELLTYACSPVSYLIAVLFYLFHGLLVSDLAVLFHNLQLDQDTFATRCYDLPTAFFMVILVPGILTMRCFAEERRTGSMELLMTAPVRDFGVVAGKWLAAVIFYALLWLPTTLLLWVLTTGPFLDSAIHFGPVFAGYLGLFLLAAMLLAVGCFASSLTDNVLLAAIVSILANVALMWVPTRLRMWYGNSDSLYVAQLVEKIDVFDNFRNWFSRGLIDTSQIFFYVGGIAFFLFLTSVTFTARRVAA